MESKTSKLDRLFDDWLKDGFSKHDDFCRDGIIDEEKWDASPRKVLFLAKETHDLCPDLDLRPTIRAKPWTLPGYWTYGLRNTTKDKVAPYDDAVPEYADMCCSAAVMNLKKSHGGASTNDEELLDAIRQTGSRVWEEIGIIDPDIIVCNGTMWHIREALQGAEDRIRSVGWTGIDGEVYSRCLLDDKDRLWVDYYHFSARYPHLLQYYGLMGLFQAVVNSDHCPARLRGEG